MRKPLPGRVQVKIGLVLATASLLVAAAILLSSSAAPILGDYVEWVYHGVLLRDALQGHPNPAYLLKTYPVPNSLTTVGIGLIMLVMPWKLAAKLWLIAGMALGLAAACRLQAASGRRQAWPIIVIAASALLGITFWCGFTNFLLGTYLAMWFCASLLRGGESRRLYAALLVLLFFTHMIPFGFAILVLGLYAWQTGRWGMLFQTLPALVLCLWYFAGRSAHGNADGQAGMVASVPYMTPAFAAYRVNSYLKCWGFVNPASSFDDSILMRLVGAKMFIALFALNAIIATGALWLGARTAWESIRTRSSQRFFWLAIAIFFSAALVMPGAAAGISDPGGRMVQVAVWTAVCTVATRRRWSGPLLGGCALLLLAANCWLLAAVAMTPPLQGSLAGPLPGFLRKFGHVLYIDRWTDYGVIDSRKMDAAIYPTAMFLERPQQPAKK